MMIMIIMVIGKDILNIHINVSASTELAGILANDAAVKPMMFGVFRIINVNAMLAASMKILTMRVKCVHSALRRR